MNDMRNDRPPEDEACAPAEPLPRAWLPEARPAHDDPYWEHATARIVTALEPSRVVREAGAESRDRSWMSEIGDRWGAAALLAAAAVALLLAVGSPDGTVRPPPGADDLALALIASEGDPAVLWDELGIAADPVLARLTFDGVRP